jgi:YesN/AraC family two-component response regulator
MEEYLRHLGHTDIDHASNGIEAQVLLGGMRDAALPYDASLPYDIVFTDRIMPEMDGMALLRSCRADRRFHRTAFVILSGESEASFILEALGCGATSYMTKPATAETFRRTIAAVTEWLDRMSPPPASPKFAAALQSPNSGVPVSALQ